MRGQNVKCPRVPANFEGTEDGDIGTPPLRGVPVSPCPQKPQSWETDQEAFDFEERAAIREYDGGLPRAAAERLASMDLINHRRRAA